MHNINTTSVSVSNARNTHNISPFKERYKFLRNSFLQDSSQTVPKKCDSNALNIFKKISCALLEAMFSILMILRKHLTTTSRLGLSNLCEYKFKLSFLEAVAQSCSFKRVALGLQIY